MLHGTVPLFFLRILLRILEILEMPFPSPLEVRAWDWTLRKRAWWQESPTEQTICVPWGGYHCLLVVLIYSFFGSSPPSLSWHIKSLKLKKLPFLDGSFSVCVLGVGRGDWLGLNLVFRTSLEYQVINYLTVLKFGVVPFMWYLVDECSVKVSHWLPYLCVVFDKGLKVFRWRCSGADRILAPSYTAPFWVPVVHVGRNTHPFYGEPDRRKELTGWFPWWLSQ